MLLRNNYTVRVDDAAAANGLDAELRAYAIECVNTGTHFPGVPINVTVIAEPSGRTVGTFQLPAPPA